MGIVRLHTRQAAYVDDRARFKAAMFSRQTGKTFGSTLEVVDDCLDAESQGRSERWVILSRGERQAREAINEGVRVHLDNYQTAFEALEYDWQAQHRALEVVLPGGSRITALPANPDTARGFSANVLLDEFAFHQDSRAIWQALFPVVSKPGLKLRVISTPNGKGNKFYELMTMGDEQALRERGHIEAEGWSLHCCDIYQAVEGGLDRDPVELKKAIGDPEAWAQEFELQWLDSAHAWLPFDLIDAAEHADAGDPAGYAGGIAYVGIDIAARKDLFVITVVEPRGDVAWVREIIERRGATFAEQGALLDDVMRRYTVGRVCIDQTGMGEKPVEDAKRRYGEYRVEGVMFTGASKQLLATTAREQFEDRRVRIPAGHPELRADLHSLKRIQLPGGNIRFDADRDAGSHADRTWSLFLALHAADNSDYQPYAYQPVRADRDLENGRPIATTGGFGTQRGAW
ncbi:terminase large subunit domain-containing protein [Salinisphaera orenii]|uniref:Terminase n=1 Tax=Salinisphaera orenii YIM 95161 TaxID=1051139 RepID=A0A423PRJ2_9GAMM|nr:terminase family protein [Salinisphaera halophila]ROO28236.1 terminase [Salinisphaera halophila YIM 95161]